MFQIRQKMIL